MLVIYLAVYLGMETDMDYGIAHDGKVFTPNQTEAIAHPMTTDFDFVFAIPGQNHIIDAARPDGRSQINGQTLDEIRARGDEYRDVVLMPWEEYRAGQIARQNTPITWEETTAEKYDEMLCVLPPAVWDSY